MCHPLQKEFGVDLPGTTRRLFIVIENDHTIFSEMLLVCYRNLNIVLGHLVICQPIKNITFLVSANVNHCVMIDWHQFYPLSFAEKNEHELQIRWTIHTSKVRIICFIWMFYHFYWCRLIYDSESLEIIGAFTISKSDRSDRNKMQFLRNTIILNLKLRFI